jgi:hypothetical protein
LDDFLSRFPSGTKILDAPVRTACLFDIYAHCSFTVCGADVAKGIVAVASGSARELKMSVNLYLADTMILITLMTNLI